LKAFHVRVILVTRHISLQELLDHCNITGQDQPDCDTAGDKMEIYNAQAHIFRGWRRQYTKLHDYLFVLIVDQHDFSTA
jgi:hypothetical protein